MESVPLPDLTSAAWNLRHCQELTGTARNLRQRKELTTALGCCSAAPHAATAPYHCGFAPVPTVGRERTDKGARESESVVEMNRTGRRLSVVGREGKNCDTLDPNTHIYTKWDIGPRWDFWSQYFPR